MVDSTNPSIYVFKQALRNSVRKGRFRVRVRVRDRDRVRVRVRFRVKD